MPIQSDVHFNSINCLSEQNYFLNEKAHIVFARNTIKSINNSQSSNSVVILSQYFHASVWFCVCNRQLWTLKIQPCTGILSRLQACSANSKFAAQLTEDHECTTMVSTFLLSMNPQLIASTSAAAAAAAVSKMRRLSIENCGQ